ncbi:lipid-transfer protein [Catenulispora sp. NF23]|uniref:lipid-transfer protein n=1 Tax=Catenulispora pinistramenti TaxID=2705254 RepID=UPI001BA69A57|nr:lipid-transfer protein [Catenulispora pinistramenti]MBS2539084.1 lipid-transfer protein [Catenulispora pinistramenti]
MSRSDSVAVAGVGMHPWGAWGRPFVEYGLVAARAALADAGVGWRDVQLVVGGETIRNGYPGFVAGSALSQALGWQGAPVASCYAACATGAQALATARAHILAGLADVVLVVGADATPKGFFAPVGGDRPDDPDWLRFRLLGATNPAYFGLYARRRMALRGSTEVDFAAVKVKNARAGSLNPNARFRAEVDTETVLKSPMVSDPLRLLQICATSDGAAAVVLTSEEYARRLNKDAVRIRAISAPTPTYPRTVPDFPYLASDSLAAAAPAARGFRESLAHAAYEAAGLGPQEMDLAEVYDLTTAMELDWYEEIGLCAPGEAEKLLHDGATALGGRIPVNPSGGLSSFGEAIPAQAIAQVCELTWQLRGAAGARQVAGARAGVAVNQGLFGHGSAIVVGRA